MVGSFSQMDSSWRRGEALGGPMLRRNPVSFIAVGLLAVLSGCVGKYQSDFPLIVVNRLTTNTIQVLANGNDVGQVAAGQTGSFSLKLAETNQNVFTNGAAPTPQAEVTISAKDLKTLALSLTKSLKSSAFICDFFRAFSSWTLAVWSNSCCILVASQMKEIGRAHV